MCQLNYPISDCRSTSWQIWSAKIDFGFCSSLRILLPHQVLAKLLGPIIGKTSGKNDRLYRQDLNNGHPITGYIWLPDFLVSSFYGLIIILFWRAFDCSISRLWPECQHDDDSDLNTICIVVCYSDPSSIFFESYLEIWVIGIQKAVL